MAGAFDPEAAYEALEGAERLRELGEAARAARQPGGAGPSRRQRAVARAEVPGAGAGAGAGTSAPAARSGYALDAGYAQFISAHYPGTPRHAAHARARGAAMS